MKNIITLAGTGRSSNGAMKLSCDIASLTLARITGVFCQYPDDNQAVFSRFVDENAPTLILDRDRATRIDAAIRRFSNACALQRIPFDIQRTTEHPEADLALDSLFTDLMIVDAGFSLSEEDTEIPSGFVTALLHHVKCPVLVAATVFSPIEEIVFAYDGTFSSVFAIKQFTYLFPELRDRRISVVEVTDGDTVTEASRLGAWLQDYYSTVYYERLSGNAPDRLFEVIMSKQNALLVIGAFGRTAISSFFHSSAAETILRFTSNPVFIAHY